MTIKSKDQNLSENKRNSGTQESSKSGKNDSKSFKDHRPEFAIQGHFADLVNGGPTHPDCISPGSKSWQDNRLESVFQRKFAQTANSSQIFSGKTDANRVQNSISDSGVIIQRQVFKDRKTKKWYTDKDESIQFDTYEKAHEYQRSLLSQELEEKDKVTREKKAEKTKKRKREFEEKFGDYSPPKAKKARLFKYGDKEFDDVDLTELGPSNAKKFMEFSFQQRKAELFGTQVIKLGGYHHVIAPGTDIGLTPAILRPDLKDGHSFVPLSRDGTAKPYTELASGLDQIANGNVSSDLSLNEVRERMGKDIMRMTRGNPPKGNLSYSEDQLSLLNEIAAVLRLDKGRVPKATKYIRQRITKGNLSFDELFSQSKYVGAGKGGVEALRGKVSDDGELSEGSDIEEEIPEIKLESPDKIQPDSDSYEPNQYMNQQELMAAILDGKEQVGNTIFLFPSGEWRIKRVSIAQSGQSFQVNIRLQRKGG